MPLVPRVEIIAASVGKPSPGSPGTLGGAREPGLQVLRLPLASKLDEVPGEIDRLGHLRRLGAQRGEPLGVVLGALLLMPYTNQAA